MKIFVPGRVCLLGEHSDWAGGYRRIISLIDKGYCIITGTNQGIYADVQPEEILLKRNSNPWFRGRRPELYV